MNMLPPEHGQPDARPRFRQAVHVDDLSNPKRPKIETRHREAIIAPGKRIEASDRDYYVNGDGSLMRAHTHLQGASRRSKAKPATKAQQKSAARIEAKIRAREAKRDGRTGQAAKAPSLEVLAAQITAGGVATLRDACEKGLTGDPYQDQKRQEGE